MARLCFMDWETEGPDLTVIGTLNYVLDPTTKPLLLSWAIDQGPMRLWCRDLSDTLHPAVWAYVLSRCVIGAFPHELHDIAADPAGYFVAWNMAFDRAVAQQVATPEHGFPKITIEKTLDAMAQASASNLPGKLDLAGRAVRLGTKTINGSAIMKRMADPNTPKPGDRAEIEALAPGKAQDNAIAAAIAAWALYLDYSEQDTELMRQVWRVTRPLDGAEWAEYWVNEHINDKGMLADLDVCAGAAQYREEEALHVAEQCSEITAGLVAKPTMSGAINDWLFPRLPDDLAELMVKERDAETGEVKRLTGAKDIITRLLEEIKISETPPDDDVIDLLELLQYGRSSSAVKFQKVLDQAVDGRLHNSYVFNGAGQSGRYSSRGVQVHNLVRDYLRAELDILDKVAARVPIEDLRAIPISDREIDVRRAKEGKTSVSSVLSRLIRPTFMAPKDKLMVWSDWSAIEARVAPWLAGTDEADRAVLQPFRDGSDLYLLNAEAIFGVPYDELVERLHNGDKEAKGMRQAGKVAVLALGFLGGVGALRAMARGYGMRLTNEEAKVIVDGWRDRNRWARKFGDACERAAYEAISNPMRLCKAGRVSYQYVPTLMGGSLLCYLPDGRPLMYPMARVVDVEKFGKPDKAISYLNGMGRRNMWNGLQLENATQGLAASILRSTLTRVHQRFGDVIIGDTHDEVICEVDATTAWAFADQLDAVMVEGFPWSKGLPLAAETTVNWYYSKGPGMRRPQ